jgi:hypothetical protein
MHPSFEHDDEQGEDDQSDQAAGSEERLEASFSGGHDRDFERLVDEIFLGRGVLSQLTPLRTDTYNACCR